MSRTFRRRHDRWAIPGEVARNLAPYPWSGDEPRWAFGRWADRVGAADPADAPDLLRRLVEAAFRRECRPGERHAPAGVRRERHARARRSDAAVLRRAVADGGEAVFPARRKDVDWHWF